MCNDDQNCVDSKCVAKAECSSKSDCGNNQICKAGKCEIDPATEDPCAKCTSNQVCENNVCKNKPIGANSRDDRDGDTISDYWEGCEQGIDTDKDTIPDCEDLDSDGDTVPDAQEFGYGYELGDQPIDTDEDGIFDFRDPDSDGNGIPDKVECVDNSGNLIDTDGDGVLDCHEFDNDKDGVYDITEIQGIPSEKDPTKSAGDCDGDGVPDAFGSAENPWDCDKDGVPDYNDPDSDGDTITDRIETSTKDSNADGFLDRYSKDSDGDGIPDSIEGNVDTDNDTIPDYRDLDSDADGLADKFEMTCKIDGQEIDTRIVADADNDGYGDASEYAVMQTMKDNPKAANMICDPSVGVKDFYEFYFELPENANDDDILNFSPSVSKLDVVFNVDTTTSMGGEIENLKAKMKEFLIPQIKKRVSDSAIGVTEFDDFPTNGYGYWHQGSNNYEDMPFRLLGKPSQNESEIVEAVNKLSLRAGADAPESGFESLYQIATGQGVSWSRYYADDPHASWYDKGSVPKFTPSEGHWGGVDFRNSTMPVVIHITDTLSHDDKLGDDKGNIYPYSPNAVPGAHYSQNTFSALKYHGIRVISLYRPDTRPESGSVAKLGIPTDAQLSQLVTISQETKAIVPVCTFKDTNGKWKCGENKCCLLSNYNDKDQSITLKGVDPDANGLCTLSFFINQSGALSDTLIDGIDAIVKYATFDVATRVVGSPIEGSNADTSCFIDKIEALKFIAPVQEPELSCTPVAVPGKFDNASYNNGFTNFAAGTASSEIAGSTLQFTVYAKNDGCVKQKDSAQVFSADIEVYDATTNMVLDTQKVSIIVPGKITNNNLN